jgi:signal transduction histidine kinase
MRPPMMAARLETVSTAVAAAAVLSGFAVLVTWIWGLPGLSRIHPILGGMGSHAAVGFVLAGGALLLLRAPVTPARRIAANICAAVLVSMTVLTLGRWIDLSLGGLLPGPMPTASAQAFLALGLALLLIDVQVKGWRPSEFLSFAAALIALLALVAYAFGNLSSFASLNRRPLAFHTVLLMAAFAFAILAARPQAGLMSLVTSDTVAGLLVRRMLPAVVSIPVVIGWLAIEAQRAALFPTPLTMAYYAIVIIITFATMTWQIAGSLHRIDMERREAQEQVQQLNADLERRVADRTAELERVNNELEAFSYSVSHDLRAPLRRIDGFANLLVEKHRSQLSEEAAHYLSRVREGTRKMGQLVDDLLNLARLGRQALSLRVTGLSPIVEAVAGNLKREAPDRSIEWRIDSLPFVQCDPALLEVVFTNLLSNAVKYSSPRTQAVIEVGTIEQNGHPVIFVRDNGVGFSMKYAHKLFGVFQRLHRAEDFEGTGVGLATVQRIIHKHGGAIWVEADLDKGACFYFTIGTPASQAERPIHEVVT